MANLLTPSCQESASVNQWNLVSIDRTYPATITNKADASLRVKLKPDACTCWPKFLAIILLLSTGCTSSSSSYPSPFLYADQVKRSEEKIWRIKKEKARCSRSRSQSQTGRHVKDVQVVRGVVSLRADHSRDRERERAREERKC